MVGTHIVDNLFKRCIYQCFPLSEADNPHFNCSGSNRASIVNSLFIVAWDFPTPSNVRDMENRDVPYRGCD